MISSKKILYFVILSALLLCFVRGIDFMANESKAAVVVEAPTFADSGFSRLPEVETVDPNGGNTAVADPQQSTTTSETTTATVTLSDSDLTGPVSGADVTDPVVSGSDLTDPGTTAPSDTTTASTTTTSAATQTTTTPFTTTTTRTTTRTTTTRTTRTTTRTTTTRTTTRTTARTTRTTTTTGYTNSGSISFYSGEITIYVGQSATNQVRIPIGGQKRVYFSSKNPSIVTVSSSNETTALITGVSPGVGWIQAVSLNGDVCYCKVTVTDYAQEVLRLTNEQRRRYGLPDLLPGTNLMNSVAVIRLKESSTYFSHTRPNGQAFEYAAIEVGLDFYRVGENLACGQLTPQAVVTAWMNSPTHRANILDPGFQRLSVAYGIGADGYTYWTQFFWQDYD